MSLTGIKTATRCRLGMLVFTSIVLIHSQSWALVTETLKLMPNDPQVGSDFGRNVAIDGGWALVAAPFNDSGVGAVYVFDTTTGSQQFKLTPDSLLPGDRFGSGALAVSNGLAYVGGARDGAGVASIWVFDLATGGQVAKWAPQDPDALTTFGSSDSSISIHAGAAIVGAPFTDVSGLADAGAAYLIDPLNGSQIAKLTADVPQASAEFGSSVSIDSGVAAVYADGVGAEAIYLFDALTGVPISNFPAPTLTSAGNDMALNGDKLLLGVANTFPGVNGVRLYDVSDPLNVTFTSIPWPQAGSGLFFGQSVALNNDALLVSTWFSDDIDASGIVHLFDPDTGDFLDSFRPSDAVEDDQFGWSIELDGQTLIVGAPGFSHPQDSGAAYLFTIPEPATLTTFIALTPALLRRPSTRRSAITHRTFR